MPEQGRSDESIAHDTTEIASTDRSVDGQARSGEVPRDAPPSFCADAVVADRYRIVRFLARGGMGEVYEAEDTTLSQRVALKVIAPEVAADQKMIARLKREVLLARKVTHPNVCRLHDLGVHATASGPMAFLTMDLLPGDTLAAYLRARGRLTEREALPLVKQMAAGLDAAHAAGVIHRDFKSRNVMLVEEPGGALRAVVMDFGVAVAAEEEERRALDTGEGRFIGTPAYMAPEQVSGGPPSPATDVYALGVVLFEMVTGSLPFTGSRALEILSMRLTHAPPSPRSRVPSLDRRWAEVILRCLDRDPARRFASAGRAAAALEAAPSPWTRGRAIAAGALVLAALGAFGARAYRAAHPATTEASPREGKRRPTVAVLALKNDGPPDAAWLATALADSLGRDLDADEELRAVSAERVARARRDLGLGDAQAVEGPRLAQLRENLGADYVIAGRYTAADAGRLQVDATLTDARTGAAIDTARAEGTTKGLYEVVAALGDAIRKRLGAREPSLAQRKATRAASPGTPEATRPYADGEAKYRASDYVGALEAYRAAVAADPDFPLARLGVAQAAAALGHDQEALEAARTAFEQSSSLSREQQLVVESRYRATAKDWDRATEIARTLYEFFPDNVDYGIRYVHALNAAGRSEDALAVDARLKALPPPEGDDPRIDLYEAIAASKISDFKRVLVASRRAAEKATRSGNEQVLADARGEAGMALTYLHRLDEATVELEAARAAYAKEGDREYEIGVLSDLGDIHRDRGDAARALRVHEEVLALAKEIGGRYRTASAALRVANDRELLGETRGSRAMYDEARGLWEAIHDREGVADAMAGVGATKIDDGDLVGGRRDLEAARELIREVGGRSGVAEFSVALAQLAFDGGRLEDAGRELAQAEGTIRELDDRVLGAAAAEVRARLAREAGDNATAKRLDDEAHVALREAQSGQLVDADTFAAWLALDDGRAADAEALARRAAAAAHAGSIKPAEALALAALATALVAEGRAAEASVAVQQGEELAGDRVAARVAVACAKGTVLAAEPAGRAQAQGVLADARKTAEAAGLVTLALEARLALARAQAPGPRAAQLAVLARDAAARGYARIARLAGRK